MVGIPGIKPTASEDSSTPAVLGAMKSLDGGESAMIGTVQIATVLPGAITPGSPDPSLFC
jgi:hypothetical protein